MLSQKKDRSMDASQIVLLLKRGGKRFQALCNRDEIVKWKADNKKVKPADINLTPKDVDRLVAVKTIFSNAVKMEPAKKEDIEKSFEGQSEEQALVTMIIRGDLQFNEQDRQESQKEVGEILSEISRIVSSKVFNPEVKKKGGKYYSQEDIEREIKNLKYQVNPNVNPGLQALTIIKAIKESEALPIQRLQVKVTAASTDVLIEAIRSSPGFSLPLGDLDDMDPIEFMIDSDLAKDWIKKHEGTSLSEPAAVITCGESGDLTYYDAPIEEKKMKGKKGGKKGKKNEGAAEGGGDEGEAEDTKPKAKKGKKDKKKKDEAEGEDEAGEEESEKPKPKAKGKKGKKNKGFDDDSDDGGKGKKKKDDDLDAMLAKLGGGGSSDDDFAAGPTKGKKKKKK